MRTIRSITSRAIMLAIIAVAFMFLSFAMAFAVEPYGPTHDAPLEMAPSPKDTTPDGKVIPGGSVTLSGGGFAPNTKYDILWDSKVWIDPLADANGFASYAAKIPSDATPGVHTISMMGAAAAGGTLVLSTEIAVASEKTVPVNPRLGDSPNENLPLTGGVVPFYALLAGIAFLSIGLGLRLFARGR